ncbi:MAG: hypothetical protein GEV07_08670 [Streptosporangiales bacterium]|nr:hypothetical protein [Streptosporangiales bacterium]
MFQAYSSGRSSGRLSGWVGTAAATYAAYRGLHPVDSTVAGLIAGAATAFAKDVVQRVRGDRARQGGRNDHTVRSPAFRARVMGYSLRRVSAAIGTPTAVAALQSGAHPVASLGAGLLAERLVHKVPDARAIKSIGEGRYGTPGTITLRASVRTDARPDDRRSGGQDGRSR